MMLAGIPITGRSVLELATKLRDAGYDHAAERLRSDRRSYSGCRSKTAR